MLIHTIKFKAFNGGCPQDLAYQMQKWCDENPEKEMIDFSISPNGKMFTSIARYKESKKITFE